MKALKIIILFSAFIMVLTFVSKPEYRWLALNGIQAQRYAESLQSGKTDTPNWAIDYVVVSKSGVVTFSKHNSSMVFAYSPNKALENNKIIWSRLVGAWYFGHVKT